jgi:hypothetical protein
VPLCATGAFLLARRLDLGVDAAWICGLVYGFAPPRFLRIDQAHLTAVEWIPFCLAFAHAYARSGRPHHLRIAIAFLSLQALTSGHGAVFLGLALAIWLLAALAGGTRLHVGKAILDAGVWGALLVLPAALLIVPYRRVQIDVGLRRDLGDWTGSWTSFLASPTHVDGWILDRLGGLGAIVNNQAQAYLFPGWLTLVLAAAAFLWAPEALRRRPLLRVGPVVRFAVLLLEIAAAAVIGVAVYAMATETTRIALGPIVLSLRSAWRPWIIAAILIALRILFARWAPLDPRGRAASLARWRRRIRDDVRLTYLLLALACIALAIGPPYGPWQYVYAWPGLSFIRVPSRFMVVGTLAIGVLCAFGFARITGRWKPRPRTAAAIAISLAMIGEFAVAPFEVVADPVSIPAADRWLASQPAPFVVAETPPMDPTIPMLHSMAHWQKIVHGYSGWNPALSQEIAASLAGFPDDASLSLLERVGVSYVVVHVEMYDPATWHDVEARLARGDPRLRLCYDDGSARVYALEAAPED